VNVGLFFRGGSDPSLGMFSQVRLSVYFGGLFVWA